MRKAVFYTLLVMLAIGLCFIVYKKHTGRMPFSKTQWESDEGEHEEYEDGPRQALKQEVLMTKDPALGYVPTERLKQYNEVKSKILARIAARAFANGGNAQGNGNPGNPQASGNPLDHGTVPAGGGSGSGGVPGTGNAIQVLGSGLTWQERGPNNIAGRCRGILVDAADPSGNTVLVGSVSGGLWRTTNFTNASPTWTQNSTVLANLAISSIAQDPTNHSTMYAGTGEGYFNIDAIRGLGVYKSTDGGLTWNLLASTTTGGANVNDFGYVQKLAVYSNGDLYAACISASFCNSGGVLKSTDGGSTWTRVIGNYTGCGSCSCAFDFNAYDVEFSLSGDIYASVIDASGNPSGKVFKSPAGASVGNTGTWTDVTPPPGAQKRWQRIQLTCSPTNNNLLYAIMQDTLLSIGGIRRSTDGGTTWTNINNTTTWCDGGSSNGTDFSRNQAWYDLTLAVNPSNDALVYAAGVDMMTSSDSGSAWTQATQWAAGCGALPQVHADIHNLVFLPGSSTSFIIGCDGGLFFTSNGGSSFVSKDGGLNVTQYYGAAINPASGSNDILAGAQDNGSHIFGSAGINTVTTATGGDGFFCFIDQNNSSIQITSQPDATYIISRNGGASFSTGFGSTDGRFINPADYDNSLKHIYCASQDQKLRRIDNVTSGTPTATDITVTTNTQLQASAVKVDPNTADQVYVAFSTAGDANSSQVPEIWKVQNASTGGPTVTKIGAATLTLPAGAYINSIDVENGNANHLVVAVSNYGVASVWESTDGGSTWNSLDNNGINLPDMPVYWAMIVPTGDNVGTGGANGGIMLATEMGVWSTSASAGTSTVWTENSATMGNVSTRMLVLRSSDNTVVAATHGRGLFTTTITASPLPLDFVSFSGAAVGTTNALQWSVADESNNKGFYIERSYDGASFTDIGFLPSHSTGYLSADNYAYTDSLVDLGAHIAFYRLRQTDLDNKVSYSSIIAIERIPATKLVEYISVTGNGLFVRMNNDDPGQMVHAQILDMAGRLLSRGQIQAITQTLDIGGLAGGIYILRLTSTSGRQYVGRFVKR